jgi:hypothetical protein
MAAHPRRPVEGKIMQTRVFARWVVPTTLIATCIVASGPAHAETSSPTEEGIVVSSIQVAADFVADGPLIAVDEGGRGFHADYETDDHVIQIDQQVAAACSWYNFVAPVGGAWHESVPGCSLVGFDASSKHYYKWVVDPNSKGSACIQGRGYKKNGVSWVEQYEGLGCGKKGEGDIVIGNVITNAKIKGQSVGLTGTSMQWQ